MRQRILTAIEKLIEMSPPLNIEWVEKNYGVTVASIDNAIHRTKIANMKRAARMRKKRQCRVRTQR